MVARDRPLGPRRTRGKWLALALAIGVNVAFVLFLVFSVSWQNRPAAPISAELFAPPSPQVTPPPPKPPEPRPPEPKPPEPKAPEPKPPEPKPPEPTPPPKVEQPNPREAEIALKARQEAERKAREEAERERVRKEQEKREAEQKARQQRELDAMRAQAEKETQQRAKAQREAQLKAQAEREAQVRAAAERESQQRAAAAAKAAATAAQANALSRAQAEWIDHIRAKIKGNLTLPPDMSGNPEAVFEVVQLPTGEIIDVQLRKSSGVRAYDDAVQRAILKSSPLPRPDRPEVWRRDLSLRFRPVD